MPARALAVLLVVAAGVAGGLARSERASAAAGDRPPVVLLVFDEFPADALLGPDGRIDAARFPNFAALARTSTWFRSATTVFDSTTRAVPAILDARAPRPDTGPGFQGHPDNVFTLFDSLGYRVVAEESVSPLCPPSVCPGSTPGTADAVLGRLRGNDRHTRLRDWIASMRRGAGPTLYMQHALLPHEPWIYLPSGRQNRPSGKDPVGAVNRPIGFHDALLTDHNHLRHLLQVGSVDHDIGLLIRHLRGEELFDRALIAVVADHGYSFEVGADDRRQVTDTNIAQIAPVPYFVKAPGQRKGRVADQLVRTVDLLPTIADLLGVRIPWRHEGRSGFSASTLRRKVVRIPRRDFSRVVSIEGAELERRRRQVRLQRARKFGSGSGSRVFLGDPWASAYLIGPHPELIGRPVDRDSVTASGSVRAALANARLLRSVRPGHGVYPTRVTGILRGGTAAEKRDLAVAANGRIQAVGRSFRLRGQRPEYFSLVLPESSLHAGRNTVEILEVGPGRLTSLGRF